MLVLQVVHLIAAVWFNSYKRRLNVVTAGQLSSVESSVSYWRPEAVNQEEPAAIQDERHEVPASKDEKDKRAGTIRKRQEKEGKRDKRQETGTEITRKCPTVLSSKIQVQKIAPQAFSLRESVTRED